MQYDAKRCAGILFTIKKIQEILDNKKLAYSVRYLWKDFKGCEYPPGCSYGMDTAPRDVWFSIIANHYTGQDWPCNGDGDSTEFFKKLIQNLEKDNVKLK